MQASDVTLKCAYLDGTLCQQQAHITAPTKLCQLELLSTVEHDVLGCVDYLLIPPQIWNLHAANCLQH